ncbi:MAG: ATP synthase F1 subunit delta [Candidatus Portnoybacteria bacterium CG10_big_fil_rev_8_21_14_0_10_36_7]|uniref:ATP synthase F1 subunit delta n=1 Tax=Candidatus Portnoybacteria bacterium CG10_big_fil_rev_8_21_14_0_10_36_7 TaxID=1974812 RepID=A0A2M8KE74_9BACT|nr:MAG: ATP synthase F1 subunit delta [Candidatus Portnoybacteria bacterium CG10_big_fil_rev_8_21_14_0_10_36_7]
MKTNPLQYAKLLYEITRSKTKNEIDVLIPQVAQMLQNNGQIGKIKEITDKFSAVYNKNENIVEAEIISRETLPSTTITMLNAFLKTQGEDKKIILKQTVSPNLKGGAIIKIGDEIIDLSIDKQLNNLKNTLIN